MLHMSKMQLRKEFHLDIVRLKTCYRAAKSRSGWLWDDRVLDLIDAYYAELDRICKKYGKSYKQITDCLGY